MTGFHMTRAMLAPGTRNLGALLADSSDLDAGHRLVWTLFPGDEASRDFVYREADRGSYLIVSKRPAIDQHGIWRLDSKSYEPAPVAGERYGFALRANPSIDLVRKGHRSQRVDAVMHAKTLAARGGQPWSAASERSAALAWLYAREGSIGVRFDPELCDAAGYKQVALSPNKAARDRRPIRHALVDFAGVLDVVDAPRFAEKLRSGIGRAKAFGCGLMLIRRI